jgi:L-asparagine transporter-like permease
MQRAWKRREEVYLRLGALYILSPFLLSAILRRALISARSNFPHEKLKTKIEVAANQIAKVALRASQSLFWTRRLKSSKAAFGWRKIDAS